MMGPHSPFAYLLFLPPTSEDYSAIDLKIWHGMSTSFRFSSRCRFFATTYSHHCAAAAPYSNIYD